jgi:hypothetical protein
MDVHKIEAHMKECIRLVSISKGVPIGLLLTANTEWSDTGTLTNYALDPELKVLRAVVLNQWLVKVGEVEVYAPQLFREPERGF